MKFQKCLAKDLKNMWKPNCDEFKTFYNSNLESLKQQGTNQYFAKLQKVKMKMTIHHLCMY